MPRCRDSDGSDADVDNEIGADMDAGFDVGMDVGSGEDWESDEDEEDNDFPYTPQELGEIILDFYRFLTKLHFRPEDLKIPPPEGWPESSTKDLGDFKSAFVLETMRHLPYIKSSQVNEYKSQLISYWQPDGKTFDAPVEDSYLYDYCEDLERDSQHIIQIAAGWESGGVDLYLNTRAGEIVELVIRYGDNTYDPRQYVDGAKKQLETLQLIPYREGFNMLLAGGVEDTDEHITEEEVLSEEGDWQTDLSKRYLRQLYREHGWPHEFRREQAFSAVDDLLVKMKERGRDTYWDDVH